MINPFQMLQNPLNQQLQMRMAQMKMNNPTLFRKVEQMTNGKNENELKEIATNLASERGLNLNQFASQFGIKL